jgi:hypothetical protein
MRWFILIGIWKWKLGNKKVCIVTLYLGNLFFLKKLIVYRIYKTHDRYRYM